MATTGQSIYASYHPSYRLEEALAAARAEAQSQADYEARLRSELEDTRARLQQYRGSGSRARSGAAGGARGNALAEVVKLAGQDRQAATGRAKERQDAAERVRRQYEEVSPVALPYIQTAIDEVQTVAGTARRDPTELATDAVRSLNEQLARGTRTFEGLSTPQRQLLGLTYMARLAQLPQFQAAPELLEVVSADVASSLNVPHLRQSLFLAEREAAERTAMAAMDPGLSGFEQQARTEALASLAAERGAIAARPTTPAAPGVPAPREATLEEMALGRYLQALQDPDTPGQVTAAELEAMGEEEAEAAVAAYRNAQATGQFPAASALLFDPGYLSDLRRRRELEVEVSGLPTTRPTEESVRRRALEIYAPYAQQVPELAGELPPSMQYGAPLDLEPGAPSRQLLRQVGPAAYTRLQDFLPGEDLIPRNQAEQVAARVLTASSADPSGAELDNVVSTIREALPEVDDQREALTYVLASKLQADQRSRRIVPAAPSRAPAAAPPAPAPVAAPPSIPTVSELAFPPAPTMGAPGPALPAPTPMGAPMVVAEPVAPRIVPEVAVPRIAPPPATARQVFLEQEAAALQAQQAAARAPVAPAPRLSFQLDPANYQAGGPPPNAPMAASPYIGMTPAEIRAARGNR
jgi:hypothetical protein